MIVPVARAVLVYTVATNTWRTVMHPEGTLIGFGGAAVWAGEEVLFWGYQYHEPGTAPWAESFDPATNTWRSFHPGPLGFREYPAAAWTGAEMIVFGDRGTNDRTSAAAYSPTTDTWRGIAPAPDFSWQEPRGFWTGSEMLVIESAFGPIDGPIGIAYSPESDMWRLVVAPQGTARAEYAIAWTGSELLFIDGSPRKLGSDERADNPALASAYDPQRDSWRTLPAISGQPTCRSAITWTGSHVVAYGGNKGCTEPLSRPRRQTWILKW